MRRHSPSPLLPSLAIALNALIWGLSWWPLHQLQARGLHPLWATVLMYSVPVLAMLLWRRWPLKLLRIAPQRLRMSIVRKMARPPEGDLRKPAVPAPTPAE